MAPIAPIATLAAFVLPCVAAYGRCMALPSPLSVSVSLSLLVGAGAGCFSDPGRPDVSDVDTGEESDDTGPAAASCSDYCTLVSACDADFPQYVTTGPCDSVCELMPKGTQEDQTGNTVGCRTFYAIQAGEGSSEKETFCQNSGPAGNGVCGGVCESFCAIAVEACADVYPSVIDCTTACMGWDATEPYAASSPEGDTFACRMKHLTYATLDPDTHCGHVADASPVCVN
jgi:hypothetical protein